MEYPLLSIFTLLNLAVVATHAALPPEFYWKSVLPTTPMPKAITDILHLDLVEDKSTNVGVGKGGEVPVRAGRNQFFYKYAATETELHDALNVGKGSANEHAGKGSGTNVNIGGKGGGVPVSASPNQFRYKYGATETELHNALNDGKGSVNVHAGKGSGTNVNVGEKGGGVPVSASPNQFRYNYGATETELHDALNDGKGSVNVHAGKGSDTNVNIGGKGGGVPVSASPNQFRYNYGATETELHDALNDGKGSVNVHAGKGSDTNVNIGGKGGGVPVSASPNQFRYNYGATETELHDALNDGKGSINVHAGKGSGTNVNVGGKGGGVPVSAGSNQFRYNYGATETELHDALNDGKGSVNMHAGKGSGTNVNVGGKGGGVPVSAGPNQFRYNYAATETELHDDLNNAVFFFEKDLHPGAKLNFHFTRSSNAATFLPRQVADSIPFSSNKVDDILNKFSFKPESKEAEIVKITINECEEKGIRGEEKYCATSLESMVDFSTSKLGKNIEAVSTEVVDNETKLQKYTMTQGVKKLPGDKVVVCHKQNYPYAVFYCHKTETARAYFVPLEGVNGIRVKAIAVCHTDTSEWNPKHLAFQVLKIKPGNVPVCHFLPEDHVVWVPK